MYFAIRLFLSLIWKTPRNFYIFRFKFTGYGIDSGNGTIYYLGKSVISSGFFSFLSAGGFKITGAGVYGSLKWASPSHNTEEILLYLAAFFNI